MSAVLEILTPLPSEPGVGDGGLRLDVLDNDSILNASGMPLGGPGAGNGNFTTGEAYTIDKTASRRNRQPAR